MRKNKNVAPEVPEKTVETFTPTTWAGFQHLPTRLQACRIPITGNVEYGTGEVKMQKPCEAGDYIVRYPGGSQRLVPEKDFKRYYQPVNEDGAAMMRGA